MWYIVLFAALLGADQLIKYWTVEHLALGESAAFLPGIVQLTRVHNYGAAWSSFSGMRWLLVAVTSVIVIAVAVVLLRRIVRHPWRWRRDPDSVRRVGTSSTGAAGYVVDMFHLEFWPPTRCSTWRTSAWCAAPCWR